MEITTGNRAKLDRALAKQEDTLLLIDGSQGELAARIHETALQEDSPYRKTFLIQDTDAITAGERTAWFGHGAQYAIWSTEQERTCHGPLSDLVRADTGDPSLLEIRQAFAIGEGG